MAAVAWVWGVRRQALSHPRPLVLSGCGRGPLPTGCGCGGLRAWGPVTKPTARALASWLCALWGRHEGARGGAPPAWVWGVRGRALSHPRPPVLSGVRPGPASHWPWVRCAGVGARLSLAPSPVPWFIVCCARFPGSRHPVAVVAWHLSSCRGCRRWRAPLACLVARHWCAAHRPVMSLSALRSAFPSPWCLPPPRGLSPPALLGGCAGHVETGREPGSLCLPLAPAEARALGPLCVVPVRGPACQPSWLPLAIFPIGGKMTHKWGRMATYPKLGDSQLSLREERPHGGTPHLIRVSVPSPSCPYPWSSGARNLGGAIRGRRGMWPFLAKWPKFTQKWSLENSYLRITRERSLGLLHGCKQKLCFPFATRVEVQSIMETFLTPQSLKHTIYGKKCMYRRYWYVHIFGTLRSKNMSKRFWSRPIVGALE